MLKGMTGHGSGNMASSTAGVWPSFQGLMRAMWKHERLIRLSGVQAGSYYSPWAFAGVWITSTESGSWEMPGAWGGLGLGLQGMARPCIHCPGQVARSLSVSAPG